jgi:hypothetical protein
MTHDDVLDCGLRRCDAAFQVEFGLDAIAARPTHATRCSGIRYQAQKPSRELLRILWWHKVSGVAVADHLRNPTDGSADRWSGTRHGLEQCDRKAFHRDRAQRENIYRAE